MNKKKILTFFHRVDADGVFSYCILRKWLEQRNDVEEIIPCGWTYGDPMPELDTIDYDELYMVDISFPGEFMKKLYSTQDVIWIDHHGTAISDSEKFGYSQMEGLRRNGTAAVELTWEYFFGKQECPELIQYLGAYDVWDKRRFDWEGLVVPIQIGVKAKWGLNFQEIYQNFDYVLSEECLQSIISEGKLLKDYEESQFRYAVKSYAFPVTVAGKFKGIAMLTQNFGSRIFASVLNDYDVYVTANRKTDENGNPYFAIGLYAEPGRIDFDLGKYVKETYGHGAGGHPGACGMQTNKEVFRRLIIEGRI